MTSFRDIGKNYREEFFFFLLLSSCTVLSHWLSQFMPVDLFENVTILFQHSVNMAICFIGAFLLFMHSDGMRIRRACAYTLAIWGIAEVTFLLQTYLGDRPVLTPGSETMTSYMLLSGNFLGWLLLIYPTETLRPGWLNVKRALLQLLPLIVLSILDYFVSWDLRWLTSLYPALLFVLVCIHIRAYRIWCENNYSSMDHIDVQWIVRYLIMMFVIGMSYGYVMISNNPCRLFTQNLLLTFFFSYSIEQILFRKDPWDNMTGVEETVKEQSDFSAPQSEKTKKLEQWMETDKPYLNPNLKLIDLIQVLPMNRTYLSEFINTTYGCTFYQFVTRYRIEEAKRLMRECPELKLADVAARSGFSSPSAFTKIFTKETGHTPSEWFKRFFTE